MNFLLENYNEQKFEQYKSELSKLYANIIIIFAFPPNKNRHEHKDIK